MQRGTSLIELLVVVSVVAILAAIAVPNFLEAQTRAKTARVLSDIRTMSVAIEAYATDQGVYPRMTWSGNPWYDRYAGHEFDSQGISGTLGYWVTTPVAYLSRFDFLDPFVRQSAATRFDARLYTYHDALSHPYLETFGWRFGAPNYAVQFRRNFGEYNLMSIGPDQQPWTGPPAADPDNGIDPANYPTTWQSFWIQYDPTNGTLSDGNIWRGEKMREPRPVLWDQQLQQFAIPAN